ncbi:MAG: VapC toxin family PIN domain ribonuclease [Deltaproteobacteria bacterium]|nr:PIN domain-containing protein [Deltaproteobacteria bacterium]MBW2191388.1 PIN domain-containing protein [Deltaproteobacteria bacterium]MBW2223376.1 PIN domain-containing protein [Deltaproteobacteria bacterium]MBW2402503.1 PIN domain-containing protein [Deltaproteobacteria bacterium]MBW2717884.1 PIN domain-containing protein [Deltaproteobacteria bacterium]
MIAVDTNILVHAHRADSEWHEPAHACIKRLAEGTSAWAIPWPCLHELLAIVTHPRIYDPPTPLAQAIDQVEAWLESPSLVLLSEDGAYWEQLKESLLQGRVRGAKVHDARVAALSTAAGASLLWTADRDFSVFGSLKTTNPLLG